VIGGNALRLEDRGGTDVDREVGFVLMGLLP
jgi:hypothetical protein